jgi:hypothetical protein
MKKSLFCVLSAAAVIGAALTSTAASAAVTVNAGYSAPLAGDPDSTVTFTVTSGELSLTAPTSANLGSGAPGTTITGNLGPVTVTDNRALLTASWTVTASAFAFTTGGGTPNETIPATDVGYNPGSITTTGTILATGTPITLANTAAPVVTGTDGVGNNTATWNPALAVAVPAAAAGGIYTGTLTQSVA